ANSNPANTLKTLLHRVRATVDELHHPDGSWLIRCRRGIYTWNRDIECIVDADVFEDLCKKAEEEADETRRHALLEEAVDIYKGDFLPLAARESWAIPICSRYRAMYLRAVHALIALLTPQKRWTEIVLLCRRATEIDPYDEELHRTMIRALAASGGQKTALEHYEKITSLYYNQFGISPSPELTALYREIARTTNETQTNLGLIREELRESEASLDAGGAFFCEYEFFKDFYRLCVRSLSRSGQSVQLALITLSPKDSSVGTRVCNSAMDRLRAVIAGALRRGDVFARYSLTQYLILLPASSFENGEKVLRRVIRSFNHAYPKMPVLLTYAVLPVDMVM
ncbi:MAG: bacterial transcriptional activator domain-containing protein, partial [Oscillospiraceae bacterium]|nr:bacterial transcriptional activator domain-containing protein [Oscillospiraceae bacterium]